MRSNGEFGTRGRAALICGLAAVLALGAVGGATAGKKLKAKSAETSVAEDETGSVTAKCKRGSKAISGGFRAEFEPPVETVFIALDSLRDGGRGWTASAHHYIGIGEEGLTSFAYCRDQKVKTASESAEVDGMGDPVTAVASCPPGTKVLSGGFDGSLEPVILPYVSRKLGKREWEVTAYHEDPGDFEAQVNCHEGKNLKTKQATETIPATGDDLSATAVARCSRKQRVVSGGFAQEDEPSFGGPFTYESYKQGQRAWAVSAWSAFETDITAYAYCERKKKKK